MYNTFIDTDWITRLISTDTCICVDTIEFKVLSADDSLLMIDKLKDTLKPNEVHPKKMLYIHILCSSF